MGFTSLPALIMVASTVILLALFIFFERRADQPIVDLNLFKNRSFASSNLSLNIMFIAIAANTFMIPFYLIDGLGYSASEAGLLFATVSFASLVIGPVSGWLSDKIGYRLLCTVGLSLVCLSLFLLSGLGIESSRVEILIRLIVLGVGLGMFSSPNNSSIMGSVPREKLSTGSAMIATVRQVGMSCGIAIAGAIFTGYRAFHASQLAQENLSPGMLNKLSLIGGYQDTIVISAIICSVGILASLSRGKRLPNQ